MSIEELKKLHYEGSKKLVDGNNFHMRIAMAYRTPYHDIQEKIFSSGKYEGYHTRFLNGLAKNKNLSPSLQIPIIKSTPNNIIHSFVAENPNIHPDTIQHLIDHHHHDHEVRYGLEMNKSLSRKQKHDIIDSMLEKNEDYL